jgi:hypothetical protein
LESLYWHITFYPDLLNGELTEQLAKKSSVTVIPQISSPSLPLLPRFGA